MLETTIGVLDFLASTIFIWGKVVAALFLLGIISVWVSCHKKTRRIAEGMIEEITETVKNQCQDLSPAKLVFKQQHRQEFIDGIVDGVKKPAIQAVILF